MIRITSKILLLSLLVLASMKATTQQSHSDTAMHSGHIMVNETSLKWMTAPPFLPAGAQLAVLEGDPAQNGPFALRLLMPANYRIPPHTHPTIEHVTVVEGNFYMGTGTTMNTATAMELKPGGFAVMPAEFTHYAFTKGRTIVQVHGMGPFAIKYSNPADDPRNKK
ncbi:cupin domain-containing protein [Chitinophagaceae bacterium LB-8]|uniref:Cupin domain-containing protein n=1 Tax=Paraflavisolibacter caeni TaxID=2982496 RepID=A0A9X2XY81_9BACT|nr:cupin domain-containing protein [Paraflavisolibacter caeni]MCU7551385.1 cupin domain-containing protein [Paraflavisolibacter caeni]